MKLFQTTFHLNAPASRIWPALADVLRWPDWTPTVASVQPLDGPDLQLQRRYRVTQPRLQPAVWTVTTLEPGRCFVWQARLPGLTMTADHALLPDDGQGTPLQLSFAFAGWLAPLVAWRYGALVQQYLQTEAQSLARHVAAVPHLEAAAA